jgi:pyruvate dehydrogenase complex dehydrogenase (E1) component
MEGARMIPRDVSTLDMLRQLERKVLWLSTYMIHHANHEAQRGDGLKVGGHQASSASLVTLMTALYFHILHPEDRVAVKPHASPVFHAIQYLLGNQTLDKLKTSISRPARSVSASPPRALPAWCRITCTPRAGRATGPRFGRRAAWWH